MRNQVHLANLSGQRIRTLQSEEVKLMNISIDKLIESSKRKWSFYYVRKNQEILIEQTDNALSELAKKHPNSWKDLEEVSILMNFYFLNFLASINTFLDQNCKFLSKRFGKDCEEKVRFEKLTSKLFDEHFEYRLLYKLRNYTVHAGFSICGISSEEKIIDANTKSVIYSPCLLKGELLKNKSYLGSVKKDIEDANDKILIYDLIHKSMTHYKSLETLANEMVEKSNSQHKIEIINILNISENELGKFQLIIEDANQVKVAQIPYHYLK